MATNRTADERTPWRAIPGFEGLYEVSEGGRVRSVDRVLVDKRGQARKRKGKLMYLWAQDGVVMLSKNGDQATHKVSDLVAAAFGDES